MKKDKVLLHYFVKYSIKNKVIHVYGTEKLHPQLNNALQFRLNRIKKKKDLLIIEINQKKKTTTILKNVAAFEYADKTLILFHQVQQAVASLLLHLLQILGNLLEKWVHVLV